MQVPAFSRALRERYSGLVSLHKIITLVLWHSTMRRLPQILTTVYFLPVSEMVVRRTILMKTDNPSLRQCHQSSASIRSTPRVGPPMRYLKIIRLLIEQEQHPKFGLMASVIHNIFHSIMMARCISLTSDKIKSRK